jgi:hypothetical protein
MQNIYIAKFSLPCSYLSTCFWYWKKLISLLAHATNISISDRAHPQLESTCRTRKIWDIFTTIFLETLKHIWSIIHCDRSHMISKIHASIHLWSSLAIMSPVCGEWTYLFLVLYLWFQRLTLFKLQ